MPSSHGRFEPGGNLEDMIRRRLPVEAFRSLSLPSVYDEVILLAHPWLAPTFTSSVKPDWSSRQIGEHVAKVVTRVVGNPADWMIRYEFVGSDSALGTRSDRILVSCFPPAVELIAHHMGAQRVETKSTLTVIGGFISSQVVGAKPSSRLTVALGRYHERLEVSIHRDGTLRLASFLEEASLGASATAIDGLFDTLGVGDHDVAEVVLYGHRFDDAMIRESRKLAKAEHMWLSPSEMFASSGRDVTSDSTFGVVAAGALGRLLSHV